MLSFWDRNGGDSMREDYYHDYDEDERLVEDESGRIFWGSQGAGCLFVRNHPEEGWQLLIVLRSPDVMEPNTWGTTGGAVPKRETDLFSSALRETAEEVGSVPPHKSVTRYVWKAPGGSFTYTTFVLECTDLNWTPTDFNWEASNAKWVTPEDARSLPLHFGLADLLGEMGDAIFPVEEISQISTVSKWATVTKILDAISGAREAPVSEASYRPLPNRVFMAS